MTERSILAGLTPTVIIKAGGSVRVKGVESDRVTANSDSRWGLQVEKSPGKEIARARAAVGDTVLFDLRLKLPNAENKTFPDEIIKVQLGGSGEVCVPFGSNVKVYTGQDIDVQGIRGMVDTYGGAKIRLQEVYCLGNASAGSTMDLDCQTLFAQNAEFKAGSDIHFHVRELTSARIRVKDLGGYWEAHIGEGEKSVYLKSGGDVTLVTDQQVEALPPHYILGKIEKPAK